MTSITAPRLRTPSAVPTVTTASRAVIDSSAENVLQIGMDHAARDRMTLHFPHERGLARLAGLQREDRVASAAMEELFEEPRIDRDRFGCRAVTVDDGRNSPAARSALNRSFRPSRAARWKALTLW